MSILSVQHIRKSYIDASKKIKVLEDVNLEIETGEMVAIVGPSGSGKTTLLNLIGNVMPPDSGEIYINGEMTSNMNDKSRCQLRNQYFGYIVQDFALVEEESAEENIMLPTLYTHNKESAVIYTSRMNSLAERLQVKHRLKTKVKKLSGGERQRVAIIRSQICNQSIILADEPTGALDQDNTEIVMHFFRELVDKEQKVVIIVTHNQNVAEMCDRIFKLEYGTLICEK